MLPAATAFWLVIHTTTFHSNGAVVQSVRAVEHKSQGSCASAVIDLAAKDNPHPGKIVIRICTPDKPEWWVG